MYDIMFGQHLEDGAPRCRAALRQLPLEAHSGGGCCFLRNARLTYKVICVRVHGVCALALGLSPRGLSLADLGNSKKPRGLGRKKLLGLNP